MTDIPRDEHLENSLALLGEGDARPVGHQQGFAALE